MARTFRGTNAGAIENPKVREHAVEVEAQLRDLTQSVKRLSSGREATAVGTVIVSEDGVSDHGELTGLLDDDHTQYPLLSGRTNDSEVWNTGGVTYAQLDHTGPKLVMTNGNQVLTIKGESIIQTNGAGSSTLDVRGDAALELGTGSNTAFLILQSTDTTQPAAALRNNSGATGHIQSWQNNSGVEKAYIDKDGNASFANLSPTSYWTVVGKTSDTTITSDDTLNNDPALTFAVLANTKYAFRFVIFFNSGGSEDFQFAITCPSAPTAFRHTFQSFAVGGAFSAGIESSSGAANSVTGTGGNGYVVIEGMLQNGANAGSVTLQWAQLVSGGSDTTVYAGSSVQYKSL